MSDSRVYRTWRARVAAWRSGEERPTHSQINRYRSIYALAADGWRYGAMDRSEAERLVSAVEHGGPYLLTPDHEAKALRWIEARRRELERAGINVSHVVEHFDRFEWPGRLHQVDADGRADQLTPVWHIVMDDGRIEYAALPWTHGAIVEYWQAVEALAPWRALAWSI